MALQLFDHAKTRRPINSAMAKITRSGVLLVNRDLTRSIGIHDSADALQSVFFNIYLDTENNHMVALKRSEKKGPVFKMRLTRHGSQIAFNKVLKRINLDQPQKLTEIPHEIKDGMLFIDLSSLAKKD